jgi:hypothetical protein
LGAEDKRELCAAIDVTRIQIPVEGGCENLQGNRRIAAEVSEMSLLQTRARTAGLPFLNPLIYTSE